MRRLFLILTLAFGELLHASDVETRSLGKSCYSFMRITHGRPCNPAQVAKPSEDEFYGDFLWSNQLEFVPQASKLLQGEGDARTVDELFSKRRESALDSHIELGYRVPTFAVALLPYQIQYESRFSNSVLPEVDLFTSRKTSLHLQFGSYVAKDLAVGLLTRLEHQKFISSRFFLTDVLAESRDQFLNVESQDAVLLEPGVLYHLSDEDLRPELAVNLKNWGFRSSSRILQGEDLEAHFSASINPQWASARAGLGLNLAVDRWTDSLDKAFALGGYYQFGILTVLTSFAKEQKALGFSVVHQSLTAGLSFSREQARNAYNDEAQIDRVFSQIGFLL